MNFVQMIARLMGSARMIQGGASVIRIGLEMIVQLMQTRSRATAQPQVVASPNDTNGVGLNTAYNPHTCASSTLLI